MGGGGGGYSYVRVLPEEFLLKSVVITVDFKRNSSGRTRIYEYAPPPPPINALVTALVGGQYTSDDEKDIFALTLTNIDSEFSSNNYGDTMSGNGNPEYKSYIYINLGDVV